MYAYALWKSTFEKTKMRIFIETSFSLEQQSECCIQTLFSIFPSHPIFSAFHSHFYFIFLHWSKRMSIDTAMPMATRVNIVFIDTRHIVVKGRIRQQIVVIDWYYNGRSNRQILYFRIMSDLWLQSPGNIAQKNCWIRQFVIPLHKIRYCSLCTVYRVRFKFYTFNIMFVYNFVALDYFWCQEQ